MSYQFSPPLLAVVGPTASGKSGTAVQLAKRHHAEVLSVDSLQVYKYFDIGTGKVTREEREGVPHHLLNVVDPDVHYDAAHFQHDADTLIADITKRGKKVVLAGGTGLYLKALTQGLFDTPSDPDVRQKLQREAEEQGLPALYQRLQAQDPITANKVNANDSIRIIRALEVQAISGTPFSALVAEHGHRERRYNTMLVGLQPERKLLYERIDQRIEEMLVQGWTTEIEQIREKGYGPDIKPMQCIGYRELNSMLEGTIEPEEALRLVRKNTRSYARRQLTWFRKEPVRWYESPDELMNDKALEQEINTHLGATSRVS